MDPSLVVLMFFSLIFSFWHRRQICLSSFCIRASVVGLSVYRATISCCNVTLVSCPTILTNESLLSGIRTIMLRCRQPSLLNLHQIARLRGLEYLPGRKANIACTSNVSSSSKFYIALKHHHRRQANRLKILRSQHQSA